MIASLAAALVAAGPPTYAHEVPPPAPSAAEAPETRPFVLRLPIVGGEVRAPDEGPTTPCAREEDLAVVGGVVVLGPVLRREMLLGPPRAAAGGAEDAGVEGAEVTAERLDGPAGEARATSGRGGAFALALVPGRWRIRARAPGRAGEAVVEVRPAERRFDVALGLEPTAVPPAPAPTAVGVEDAGVEGAEVAGVVVGPTDDAVPGARLRAVRRDGGDVAASTRADGRGAFRLRLPPGRYRLEVEAPAYQPADPRTLDIAVEPGDRRAGHVLRLRPTDIRLTTGAPARRVVPYETPPAAVACARGWGPFGVTLLWRLDVPADVDPLVEAASYDVWRADVGADGRLRWRRLDLGTAAPADGLGGATDASAEPGRPYRYAVAPAGATLPERSVAVENPRGLPQGVPFLEPLGWL